MPQFDLSSTYEPQGDQPSAIAELSEGLARGDRFQTLLGATGTGKTFSIAHPRIRLMLHRAYYQLTHATN